MAMQFILIFLLFSSALADFTQPGKMTMTVDQDTVNGLITVKRAMYNGSTILVKVQCGDNGGSETEIIIDWQLISSPCAQQFQFDAQNTYKTYEQHSLILFNNPEQLSMKRAAHPIVASCHLNTAFYIDGTNFTFTPPLRRKTTTDKTDTKDTKDKTSPDASGKSSDEKDQAPAQEEQPSEQKNPPPSDDKQTRRRRRRRSPDETPPATGTGEKTGSPSGGDNQDDKNKVTAAKTEEKKETTTPKTQAVPMTERKNKTNAIVAWTNGMYMLNIQIRAKDDKAAFKAIVDLEMEFRTGGFLDAIDWPLLPFYGCMCALYIVLALVWLVLLCCVWRDLLRIQFWIGGVILLGMVEKAMFLAEYESIDKSGYSVKGAVIAATLVSCLKRALARMLVLIASVGFGIVKPRLGAMLNKVLAMGALYFILSAVEGCLRVTRDKADTSKSSLLSEIPLAVLDSAICWWIFTGLVDTMRTLRLRRNLVKLSLYRHFTNTLIFAVIASAGYMVWTIWKHKLSTCMTDWKELWVDDAFWHLLFSVVLMVIMFLWRPTANNQRYAFSPLLDAADKEAEEPMISDAFDGVKMRPKSVNGEPKAKEAKTTEDDLKWIEENIPASVADAAIPSILDSDEEIMTTKFEISKME